MSALPLAEASSLRPFARRTLALAAALVALALVVALVFLARARDPHTRLLMPVPRHGETVLVLDLSGSISWDKYLRIGTVLRSLADSRARFSLVLFSDQAYEALPPGTRAADLAPLVRYFTLPGGPRSNFPANPWLGSFSGGTRISAAMRLALRLARGEAARGGKPAQVMLVSDLDDDPRDLQPLADVLGRVRRARVPVRLVSLDASSANLRLFHSLLGPEPPALAAPTPEQAPPQLQTPFPWPLIALAALAALPLALHALWLPRLHWSDR